MSICLSVCPSVRPSVKRVHCDKTKAPSEMTNRKSPTSFPVSLRWTAYVARNPQRRPQRRKFAVFRIKMGFSRRKSATKFVFVACCAPHWDYFHQLWTLSTYLFLTYNVYAADTLRHAVTLTFDPLILNICNVSAITWSTTVLNCREIEQSAAELLRFNYVQFGCRPPFWIWSEVDFHNSAASGQSGDS